MLPKDLRNLVMQYHQPDEYCELEKHLGEFKNLVAGRPLTIRSMLWLGWWDDMIHPPDRSMWGPGVRMPEEYRGLLRRCLSPT